MLKLKANGRYLDLPPDIQINYVIENPFLQVDRIPVPYTLNFELPNTPTNLLALNFPNRITSVTNFAEAPSEIIFGVVTITSGYLKIIDWEGRIKVSFRGAKIEDKLFARLYELELDRYDFGRGHVQFPNINSPGHWSNNYKILMDQTMTINQDKFTHGPVKITTADENIDWSGAWRMMGIHHYLNFYNAREHSHLIGGPLSDNTVWHTYIYPMPYVHYIIDSIFGELLTENPFTESELSKLVLVSYYHKTHLFFLLDTLFTISNKSSEAELTEEEKADIYFRLNSFLPDIKVIDLLKDLLKMICATLYPYNGKYRIVKNKDVMNSNIVESWTSKLIGSLAKSVSEGQAYSYGYGSDQEIAPEAKVEFNDVNGMYKEGILSDDPEGHLIKIKTTGQIFHKVKSDIDVYTLKSSGFGAQDQADGYSVKTSISPLSMNIHQYAWDRYEVNVEHPTAEWYVPEINEVINPPATFRYRVNSEIYFPDPVPRGSAAYIMFHRGMTNAFTLADQYPYITPYNYDHFGNKLGNISLSWEGEYGLIENFHKEFKKFIETSKLKASGVFQLSVLDLKNLDLTTKKHIDGRSFFIEKLEVTLRKDSIDPCQVSLIEASIEIKLYTAERTGTFTKQCDQYYTGSVHEFKKTYKSYRSQASANAKAANDLNFDTEGQAYANSIGTCILNEFTAVRQKTFIKQCPDGEKGSQVSFSKQYTSNISQIDANVKALADADFETEGQAYADQIGECVIPSITVQHSAGADPQYGQIELYATLSEAIGIEVTVNIYYQLANGSSGYGSVYIAANETSGLSTAPGGSDVIDSYISSIDHPPTSINFSY